jgi:hypothetical protein
VHEKENGKDPEPAGDVCEIADIPRLEARPVENSVMVEMIPANVGQIRKTLMHGNAVTPILDELRVQDAGEKPRE